MYVGLDRRTAVRMSVCHLACQRNLLEKTCAFFRYNFVRETH